MGSLMHVDKFYSIFVPVKSISISSIKCNFNQFTTVALFRNLQFKLVEFCTWRVDVLPAMYSNLFKFYADGVSSVDSRLN